MENIGFFDTVVSLCQKVSKSCPNLRSFKLVANITDTATPYDREEASVQMIRAISGLK